MVVFHLLNCLIKGVLGSALSGNPAPPFLCTVSHFFHHFAMCSYISSFLAGISYSIRLILSATTFSFGDFSLIVFVVFFILLLLVSCEYTILLCQMCSVFLRIFLFTLIYQGASHALRPEYLRHACTKLYL